MVVDKELHMQQVREKYFDGERGPDLRMTHPGVRKTFEVSRMWEVHEEITRLIFLGFKNQEIADKLGITSAVVSYTRNSRVVQDKLNLMKGARDADIVDLAKDIRLKAPKALALLEEIIDGKKGVGVAASINLRAKTAENWLDRAGYPAQKAQSSTHLHAHFNAEDIAEVKKRAREGGIIIDVSPEA